MELAATHFGLTIEPPAVPPGGTLTLRYRAVNHGAVPAPPATVTFLIDPAAVDELPEIADLGVLPPGASREVSATVRLSPHVRNGGSVHVQAALDVAGHAPAGSNVAVVQVRGRAVLAAAPSRLVLRAFGPAGGVLDATIVNTGDAASGETRLVVELPPGLCAAGVAARIDHPVPPLEPGATATLTFPLALDGIPALPLQILDAALDGDGRRVALPPSDAVFPVRDLPSLDVSLERHGRRIDARITIANPNAGVLSDLVLEISWARSLRLADGSVLVDGRTPLRAGARAAAATLKSAAGGATIALARIAPRATTEICLSGYAAAASSGELAVVARTPDGECSARAALPPGRSLGPLLAHAEGTAATVAGADATVAAILTGGDEPCSLTFHGDDDAVRIAVDGTALATGGVVTLAAGTQREVHISVPVDAACADGTRLERRVRATSDRGDVTELALALHVRARAWLEIVDWLVPADGGARIAIANAGSTPAAHVRLEAADGTVLALGTIAPGEVATRTLDARAAAVCAAGARLHHAGSAEPLRIASLRRPSDASVAVTFDVPREVNEGIAFDLRWIVAVPAGARTLTVRCAEHAGFTVVTGSTTIDGHAIVDDATARIAAGIVVHAVPAGTQIAFAARGIARAAGDVALAIGTAIDGNDERITAHHVHAIARAAFPQKPDGLRFYLDAPAIDALAIDAPPGDPVQPANVSEPDDARRALLSRAVQRAGDDPVADALGVLAALMPAGAPREAFAENAERLSVKLRIPGYLAEADDYESVAARSALDRARGEAGSGPLAAPRGSVAALAAWCATIDPHVAPALPVGAYVRAFVRYADERNPADRHALEAARDDLRAALTVPA
jgi:hypothetical protein